MTYVLIFFILFFWLCCDAHFTFPPFQIGFRNLNSSAVMWIGVTETFEIPFTLKDAIYYVLCNTVWVSCAIISPTFHGWQIGREDILV